MLRKVRYALVLLIALIVGAGAWKATRPPPPVYSHLDIFLDGGMVEAGDPQIDNWEPSWPLEDTQPLDEWVIESLKWGWGIANRQELRRAVEKPLEPGNRSQAWLLGHLFDDVSAEPIWKGVLAENPDDQEAAGWLADYELMVHGPQAMLDALNGLDVTTLRLLDKRSKGTLSPAQIEGTRCAALIELDRGVDAVAACRHAGELNGFSGQRTMALALWARGDLPAAVAQARKVLADSRHGGDASFTTLAGTLLASGQRAEALQVWEAGRKKFPKSIALHPDLPEKAPTAGAWLKAESTWQRQNEARRLAWCGHVYQDFSIPDRSQACYTASEAIDPVPAQAQRLVHQAELGTPDAETNAVAAADANPNILLLAAAAWVLEHDHKPHKARAYAARAYDLEPMNKQVVSAMWQACGDLKDWPCLVKFRDLEGLDSHIPPPDWEPVIRE